MKYVPLFFATMIFLICAAAIADDGHDPFQQIAATYRAQNPKPKLPEEVHKYRVQAEFLIHQNRFQEAADLYAQGLALAPWWPQGHYDRGFILGQLQQYPEAIEEMTRYLALLPDAPDARAVQDQIYQWQAAEPPKAGADEFTDPKTGLIWRRCAEGMVYRGNTCTGTPSTLTFDQAVQHAQSEAQRTGIAWRMPTKDEFLSIVAMLPTIDGTNFPVTQFLESGAFASASTVSAFWSSPDNATFAWAVFFKNGSKWRAHDLHANTCWRANKFYVRLVRASQ